MERRTHANTQGGVVYTHQRRYEQVAINTYNKLPELLVVEEHQAPLEILLAFVSVHQVLVAGKLDPVEVHVPLVLLAAASAVLVASLA